MPDREGAGPQFVGAKRVLRGARGKISDGAFNLSEAHALGAGLKVRADHRHQQAGEDHGQRLEHGALGEHDREDQAEEGAIRPDEDVLAVVVGLAARLHAARAAAEHRARHDGLTGLPNRSAILDQLVAALANPPALVELFADGNFGSSGLDETLANKIIEGLEKLLVEMNEDPSHPLRLKAEEGLERLAYDLQHKPELRARVEAFKLEMLENQAFQRWIDGLWETSRAALLRTTCQL